jgi:hypothetical protein
MPYDIRSDAEYVAGRARFVRIDLDAVRAWARTVDSTAIHPIVRPPELRFSGTAEEIARWMLLLDSLNYCFWTPAGEFWTVEYQGRTWQRYYALVACLHRAVADDRAWLDPRTWAAASPADIERLFAGHGRIPLLSERIRHINEVGRTLRDRFAGEVLRLAREAGWNAGRIAAVLADNFASFHDVHTYNDRKIALLKRAQIFAADLEVGLEQAGGPEIVGLEALTAFADYRIPQALRHLRIMTLEPRLEQRIEAGEVITASSEEEVELRACSVWAVEQMVSALHAEQGLHKPAWMVDEYLWERSHDSDVSVRHHRTITHYY